MIYLVSTRDLLLKIRDGGNIRTLASELDMRESTLRGMVEAMVDRGYLERISIRSGCGSKCSCCSSKEMYCSSVAMYVLTEKGEEFLSEHHG